MCINIWYKISKIYKNTLKYILYPPKKNMLIIKQISTILAYSAKKKKTNITAECSVMKPLTNSDSASAKSNGALLVSAIAAMKNNINMGNSGNMNQTAFCISMFMVKFKLLVNSITNSIAEVNTNS